MFINQQLQIARATMDELIKELHQLTLDIQHHDLAQTISDLRNRINEPFMFVIVGEVKSGKSSFINALLDTGKEVCKVAPDPCTDTIQQIIFGETEQTVVLNEHLKKIILPVEILKEIAIVDTPGTNAIITHHQEISERFIPGSDLIVFVFEAKNPYRQSAWEFFDYIHADWHKKIIFILQQSDLLSAEDLEINRQGVINHAQKKGIETPIVFTVSAKQALEGQVAQSGLEAVRDYIKANITGGKAPILKLQNNIQTTENINQRIQQGLADRRAQWEADKRFRKEVQETLDLHEKQSLNQVNLMIENLLATYDRITRETQDELANGLRFFSLAKRSIFSLFGSQKSIKVWLDELSAQLEQDLKDNFDKKLRSGVVDIADSIQQMAKVIQLKIQNSQTILKHNHAIFGDIADKRSAVLQDLQEQFSGFMDRTEHFLGEGVFKQDTNYSVNVGTGSGIAVIGVVLATVTQGMAMDITGGVVTAIGFLFAGITVSLKRKEILEEVADEIAKGRTRLEAEISKKLYAYIKDIKRKIDENFHEFDALLEHEGHQILKLEERFQHIVNRLETVKSENKLLPA